ncbi:MAG: hypothetical protein UY04_C0040G0004 [Parcubacteria group bacterium GW2011_GWA2_47_7]|nr:MAG: hypothetical protein UY04_C0040G0004 [Parcubacteria group bacterium GW2011_GWA2_47_7]
MEPIGKNEIIQVPIELIDAIFLRPDEADEPGILFLLKDGGTVLSVLGSDAECDTMWTTIEEALPNSDFVRYHSVMFRAESLESVEQRKTPQLGDCIYFGLRNRRKFARSYDNLTELNQDLEEVTAILSTLQDIRASTRASETKQ